MSTPLLWTFVIILFSAGLVGIFVPFLPGIAFVFAGILLYAALTGFTQVSVIAVVIFGIVTVLAWLADYIGSGVGARAGGGQAYAIIGTIVGGIVGLTIGGPLGLPIGAALGAFGGALLEGQTHQQALWTASLSIVGMIGAAIVQFIIALLMISAFLLLVFV